MQGIGVLATVDDVVSAVAHDDISQLVTDTCRVATAGQGQVLEVRPQGVTDGRLHGVGRACGQRLGNSVASAVDDVGVVAEAASQGVVAAGTAIQHVVTRVAGDGVV